MDPTGTSAALNRNLSRVFVCRGLHHIACVLHDWTPPGHILNSQEIENHLGTEIVEAKELPSLRHSMVAEGLVKRLLNPEHVPDPGGALALER
jgi:hypothetical protein